MLYKVFERLIMMGKIRDAKIQKLRIESENECLMKTQYNEKSKIYKAKMLRNGNKAFDRCIKLYYTGIAVKLFNERANKELLIARENEELNKYSFKPDIGQTKWKNQNREQDLRESIRKKNLRAWLQSRNDAIDKECQFNPIISERSKKLILEKSVRQKYYKSHVSVHDRLYRDAQLRN